MSRTVFFNSPRKLYLFFAASAAIFLGVIAWLIPTMGMEVVEPAVMLRGLFLFVGLLVYWTQRHTLMDTSPQLIFSAEGISGPRVGARPIPWGDIKRILIVRSYIPRISIDTYNPEAGHYLAIAVQGDPMRFLPKALASS